MLRVTPFVVIHSSFRLRDCDHHFLAPIAQIGVRFACADCWPMAPAARTLFVGRLCDFNSQLRGFGEPDGAYNKDLLKLALKTNPRKH
jgi:hypothetical protein